jgi:hypothetical protein
VRTNRIEAANGAASKTRKENIMANTETKSLPAYRIFSVKTENDKSVWQEIGAAWPNKDGQGLSLTFKALPLPGANVVLRKPKLAAAGAEVVKRRAA